MSGKIKNCKGPFFIYYLYRQNYVGVTTDIKKRMLKHKSRSGFDTAYVILDVEDSYDQAMNTEEVYQEIFECKKSNVRDQKGSKNPASRMVLHTLTGVYFDTIKQACDSFGYSYSSVRHCISNHNNKYNFVRL